MMRKLINSVIHKCQKEENYHSFLCVYHYIIHKKFFKTFWKFVILNLQLHDKF